MIGGGRFVLKCMLLVLLSGGLSGCALSLNWWRNYRVDRALARNDYPTALHLLQDTVKTEPYTQRAIVAARLGARVAHLEAKNYPLAIEFYQYIVLRAPEPAERVTAQRAIAQIHFENLQDFDQAVLEYEKLLKIDTVQEDAFRDHMNLAKSHFQLNNLPQALTELDTMLEKKPTPEENFEIKMLKANILVANKQLADAAQNWEAILKEFPERANKENVGLNLVVCYEELKDFGRAIEVLEKMREDYPNPKFLDARIERLRERRANQPGAQGWKR